MRPLASVDGPGSLGPGREVEVAQLADGGALALLAGLGDGRHPGALRHGQGGGANGLEAEPEADLQFTQRVHEVVRGAAGVGTGQDLHPRCGLGQLLQGLLQHGDVIGRGVGAGVAWPQDGSQRLAALVQVAGQRMEAEPSLEVPRRSLLLGVGRDQRGVEVEGDPFQRCSLRLRPLARLSTRLSQDPQPLGSDRLDDPPGSRRRRHLAEQVGLLAQNAQVRQGLSFGACCVV